MKNNELMPRYMRSWENFLNKYVEKTNFGVKNLWKIWRDFRFHHKNNLENLSILKDIKKFLFWVKNLIDIFLLNSLTSNIFQIALKIEKDFLFKMLNLKLFASKCFYYLEIFSFSKCWFKIISKLLNDQLF